MRKFIKVLARTGRDSDVWPVALLLLAVVVPALCLLWFMNAAMRNERLAAQQKLAEAQRAQLSSAQVQLDRHLDSVLGELNKLARNEPAPVAFAKAMAFVDSVQVLDDQGRIVYPNQPSPPPSVGELPAEWNAAGRLEYVKNFEKAAAAYHAMALSATNIHFAARALQAEARSLVRAGQKDRAIQLIKETLGHERYRHAADAQGRLIAANAELMALELGAGEEIAKRLRQRLLDYENPVLAAPQRRFLMKEVRRLAPGIEFPTLAAEELAVNESNVCKIATQRAVALFRSDTLAKRLGVALGENILMGTSAESVSVSVGPRLPGWYLSIRGQSPRETSINVYLWTAVLVLAAVAVLALLAVRVVRRQTALARLKNDLVATVSHELKTPLSSMRVLVDTLMESDKMDENARRDYLRLIAGENERLSRLVQNFLTFSRMERNKHTFEFKASEVRPIVDVAVAGHDVVVRVPDNLPRVTADPDAIATALGNLLDNASKHSGNKDVLVTAKANNGTVQISVQDHGIGIPRRDLKRVFEPFYQVDQRLSRNGGGCGLGLSIVQSIINAHGGRISVESEPGSGSTFTISLPVAKET